ncbi:beta-phosphoglucomutase [Paenibacillus donghaensis]|uniref:Beta-phosphoglucomutase n=1 Tax=Paenibacillus donghaensis TaxID=414771 RepID=A0A2Z2K5F9_9BACL|nr:beta-phosphoglucomutase [Paenibacillus donghaensis]ASA19764.1 beta-phosphoglucomutase [Paenibacillus donghaensis]
MKPAIVAVIFDLDGVIVSTDDKHYEAWLSISREEGIPFDRTINDRLRGVSRMESLGIILEQAERPYTEQEREALADRKNSCYQELLAGITEADLLPGVRDTLAELKRRGIRAAIGSSSKNARLILSRLGITGDFDIIVDGNDIMRSKPDPEVFVTAAARLGAAPAACLVVEDAEAGIAAAVAAHMTPVAIGPACGSPLAQFQIQSLHELPALLE